MANTGPHIPHGFQEQAFAALETTFDTDTKPAATDAVAITEMSAVPEQVTIRSEEKTGNRLPPGHFPGMRSVKGSMAFYAKLAAVGVEPDFGAILEAALATKTIVGATSVTYAHADLSAVNSLRIFRGAGNFMEAIYGATIESLAFDIQAGQVPKITAAFNAARMARASSAVLTGAAGVGTGTCTVAATHGKRFGKGSTVRFKLAAGTYDDNSGAGYLITSDELDAITFSPVAVVGAAIGDEIMGFTPTPTTTGTVVAAVTHDVKIAGTAINFMSGKLTYKTGFKMRQEGQSDRSQGSNSGNSEVEGEVECYFREDQVGSHAWMQWDKTYAAIILRAGVDTAAARMKLNIANAVLSVTEVKMPNDGSAGTFNLKFAGKTAFNVLLD